MSRDDVDLAESVVADFTTRTIPRGTPRTVRLPGLPGKADAVIGMRRSGKTWRIFQEINTLLDAGVARERILYVNFEDERLMPLKAEALGQISDAVYRRTPQVREQGVFWFFDEIQNVPGWERFVRRLLDGDHGRVVVTGSSARLLSRELATSLRGRSLATELLPFSFEEFLRHRGEGIPSQWPPPEAQRYRLQHAADEYLEIGGLPEVQTLDESLRTRVLQDYVDAVVLRDVVERHRLTNVDALRYLVRRLLDAPAGRLTIHRLYNDLRSQGRRVSKDTLYAALGHLEDAFLIFTVPVDAASERKRTHQPRKAYPIDPGLAGAHSFRAAANTGHLLETVVFLELRRRGFELAYLTTHDGLEVDFVARRASTPPLLIQVCADLSDPKTRARELRALSSGMEMTQVQHATLVTRLEQGEESVAAGRVRLVPAWRWLLEEAAR